MDLGGGGGGLHKSTCRQRRHLCGGRGGGGGGRGGDGDGGGVCMCVCVCYQRLGTSSIFRASYTRAAELDGIDRFEQELCNSRCDWLVA